jgi:exonuclease III
MTWNVRRWDEFSTKKTGAAGHRLPMMELIGKQDPDILCLQEFYEPVDSSKSNIRYIRNQLHLPYFFFSRDYYNHSGKYETGVIIFSKFPIIAKSQAIYKDTILKTKAWTIS